MSHSMIDTAAAGFVSSTRSSYICKIPQKDTQKLTTPFVSNRRRFNTSRKSRPQNTSPTQFCACLKTVLYHRAYVPRWQFRLWGLLHENKCIYLLIYKFYHLNGHRRSSAGYLKHFSNSDHFLTTFQVFRLCYDSLCCDRHYKGPWEIGHSKIQSRL